MALKFGFEIEGFVMKFPPKEISDCEFMQVPTGIPADECGYLAEARGEPHTCPHMAMGSVEGKILKLKEQLKVHGLVLEFFPYAKLPADFRRACLRQFGKSPTATERGSMHGKDYRANDPYSRAGLHIHFSHTKTFSYTALGEACKCGIPRIEHKTMEYSGLFDMPKIIRALDEEFAREIKEAHRIQGLYEMKPHGFEYRSLPNDVSLMRVANVLSTLTV